MVNIAFRQGNRLTINGIVYEISGKPPKPGWYQIMAANIDGTWRGNFLLHGEGGNFCAYWDGNKWLPCAPKNRSV